MVILPKVIYIFNATPVKKSWSVKNWLFPWCWERLKVGGEGDDRRWDGWIASPTQWTLVWINSGSWWWTGRPGVLQSMGVAESDMTEWLNWTVKILVTFICSSSVKKKKNSKIYVDSQRIQNWQSNSEKKRTKLGDTLILDYTTKLQ